ncbi:galactokinase [Motilibacter rhizosphaerae]|uniref:Galactokinase n=1 Tax=Motilibacter rhizosphaerae TaxID=598652 RepID=A0A4Q7NQM1_9ACTN|nr:galactokinase [Motilibacter rhizosphaerae]RZS87523.1 galactokinase [Motilibacter rhizosphaerae]
MSGAADAYQQAHGTAPEGVWAAPGRVNLIGEHTDYNDGFVLPFALEQSCWVAAARRDDGVLDVRSLQDPQTAQLRVDELSPEGVEGWARYVAGTVWALREAGYAVGGLTLVVDGQVPLGSGLSSSHALQCAVALAATELHGLEVERPELARIIQRSENGFVGAPTGILDQTASLRCTDGHVLFYDCRSGDAEQVPFDAPALGVRVLVVNTRVQHAHDDGGYAERRAQCEQAARELGVPALRDVPAEGLDETLARLSDDVVRRRARHVVTEDARVVETVAALRAEDLEEVGRLLDASHVSMRDDFEISCAELDLAVESAQGAGALGARMTGGGFGGSAVALVPEERIEQVTEAVRAAFADKGYLEPEFFVVRPAAGARREA